MRDAQDVDVLASGVSSSLSGSSSGRLIKAAIIAALIVVVDQTTKWMALNALEPGPCSRPDACIDLVLGIKFNLVFNTGAAFTSGSGYGPVFGVLAFFMTGFLLYLASQRQDRWSLFGFAAIAGGAAGNLLDRIFRADDGFLSGAVIDFIDLGWWPVFNIADSAIVLGVIGILLLTAFEKPADTEEPGGEVGPEGDESVPGAEAGPEGNPADDADVAEDMSGNSAIVESGD